MDQNIVNNEFRKRISSNLLLPEELRPLISDQYHELQLAGNNL
jgi:hypothetical protein